MMQKRKIAVLLAALIFVVSACVFGQTMGNAALGGTVTDPSGAVVPNATVTVTQEGTGVARTATTNASGLFSVSPLTPASYAMKVQAAGFKAIVERVTLLADQARTVNIQLQVGAAAQTVTVQGTSTAVNTVSPVISQVIEQSRVVDLPILDRNAANLTLLVPGTTNANGHGTQQGNTKQIPGTESISVNGTRTDQMAYYLDGGSNQDILTNSNSPFPFPDAVQEFSVQTANFSAQYGENGGAVVNVVTKSGTNQWHGDAFEFVRNGALDARNAFSPSVDPLIQNQFGGTIGGPIRKDHSFIFFGYQGTRHVDHVGGKNQIIPTAANLKGDFSNYLTTGPANPLGKVVQLVDPVTGAPILNNNLLSDPNTPLNQVALNMSAKLPIASESADGTVFYQNPDIENTNEYVARFDQTVRGQDKITVRFLLDRYYNAPPYDGSNLLTVGTGSKIQDQNYLASYTWAKSANFVNISTFGVQRTVSDRTQGGSVPQMTDFGAKLFQLPKAEGGIRGFGLNGGYFGVGNFTDGKFIRNSGTIRDVATYTAGKHIIGFGGDYELDHGIVRNTDFENGNFQFNPGDFLDNSLANFLTGNLFQFSQTSGNFSDQQEQILGLFVQDQWHVNRKLTLDGGVRWEPQAPIKEIRGRIEQFLPPAAAAGVHSTRFPNAPAGVFFIGDAYSGITVPPGGETADLDNIAPRAGFAYDLRGDGKTVIRGGAGVFYYTRLNTLFGNDASISTPFSLRIDLFPPVPAYQGGGLGNPLLGQTAFTANFPDRYILSAAPSNVVFPNPSTVYSLQPGTQWITPAIYTWNLTIERQLKPDVLFRISYVGNEAANLRQDVDLNPAQYSLYVQNPKLTTNQRRIYPGISDILMDNNSGNSNYNSLQVGLEKRPGSGLPGPFRNMTLLANYTYSKAMQELAQNGGITDIGSSNGSGVPYGNPYQFQFNKGPADFNHTHNFVLSYVWPLPAFAGSSNRFAKTVIGGWNWSGILTLQTGDFMTLTAGQDQSKTGLNGDRVNFLGSVSQLGTGAQQDATACSASAKFCVPFLNTSLFGLPPVGSFGNIGEGAITGPGHWNWDMALLKNFYPFSSHESIRVQVRGDFLDAFNNPQYNDPTIGLGGNFGKITGASNFRVIQLAAKVFF